LVKVLVFNDSLFVIVHASCSFHCISAVHSFDLFDVVRISTLLVIWQGTGQTCHSTHELCESGDLGRVDLLLVSILFETALTVFSRFLITVSVVMRVFPFPITISSGIQHIHVGNKTKFLKINSLIILTKTFCFCASFCTTTWYI